MSKSSRRWWIGGVLLLVVALGFFLWPRSIRIPLKDGTTLTIAAITVGTEHSRPAPLTWGVIQGKIARRQWGWPAQSTTMPEPGVMLWFDGEKALDRRSVTLTDRHGWRWLPSSGSGDPYGYQWFFRPIETDGTALVEVFGTDGLLGTAVIPLATAVPADKAVLVATTPPVYTTPGEPEPLPIRRTVGPLEATLRSFDLRSRLKNQSPVEGRYQLEMLWNGRPFIPQVSFVTITDRFGRRDMVFSQGDQPLLIQLPPRDAIWDVHFVLFRGLDVPLDPEEMVLVTPEIPAGERIFQQEGSYQGRGWRLTLAPSGSLSLRPKFDIGRISVSDESPVIVAEFASQQSSRVRIQPLDREGKTLPSTPLDNGRFPINVNGVRCPDFDAAKGHTIRIGFDEPRIVQFTIRPEVVTEPRQENPPVPVGGE